MFRKILIANRGEIACRIIKTARRMGISTVAVYSEADKDALHVDMADEALPIGPPPAVSSYLAIDNILAACRRSGAEAVHPGYGFLSEQQGFAVALAAEGIVFIGPNPAAIAAMGDKIESKRVARAAGVATVPGYLGEIEGVDHAVAIAEEIGYPVMIKASAGGGGKGMRVAARRDEVTEGFMRARSEAKSSFGDDRVFIEKYIAQPRHIEIQVLADRHGNIVHLGERECSIQRRNQKVIEETPSPLLDAATRERMGAQAVALAKAVGYDSVGTVEFVAGQDRSFFFLEMNTRLQVEHAVTELVTGLDLVEAMIRVAAGEPLSVEQHEIRFSGAAIESRIYAEDPARQFLPSTGRLTGYRPPAEGASDGATVRVDTGVVEGGEISLYYDPLIAKLVTHASDRAAAIAAQGRALDRFVIEGIRHNVPFLSAVMHSERFGAGRLSTAFIAEEYPDGFTIPPPGGETARVLAAVASVVDHVLNERKRRISGQMRPRGLAFPRERVVMLGSLRYETLVDAAEAAYAVRFGDDDPVRVASDWKPGDPLWTGTVGERTLAVQLRPVLNGFVLVHAGTSAEARVYAPRAAELAALMPSRALTNASAALTCPMPGLVKSILVKEGQEVKAGEPLAVIEAMKMENVLSAERDAVVGKIVAAVGDSLGVDAVIMEFVRAPEGPRASPAAPPRGS